MLLQSKLIKYQQQAEKLVLGYECKQKQNVPLKISLLYLKKPKSKQNVLLKFFKHHVDHSRGQLVM